MISRLSLSLLIALLGASTLTAQEEKPETASKPGFALTIYSTADPATFDPRQFSRQQQNGPASYYGYGPGQPQMPGYGVVREVRPIDLKQGLNTIRFTDVAEGIDPTTVAFKSLTAPEATKVVEQDYQYDLVSADKMLQKYLGKPLTLLRKSAEERLSSQKVTLLSFDEKTLVVRARTFGGEDRGPVQVIPRNEDLAEIALDDPDADLVTKPTLVWNVFTEKAGQHDAQVSYQTDGLTWRADYNLIVSRDDKAVDIGSWVTILNESGAAYPDATLKLVAGDVQRLQPPQKGYAGMGGGMGGMGVRAAPRGFTEKSFFEYHLYTLGRPTSLANHATKQIELFPTRTDVPVQKTFVYYGLPENQRYSFTPHVNQDRELGTQSNKSVDIYLILQNSEKNGLGIPLPAGRVRVLKRDEADAALEFIGEDVIQHTPKNEQVMIKLGSAFDVVGERKQTNYEIDTLRDWLTESFEIKLRNHKDEPVQVIVKENLFRWINWSITESSQKYEKQDARTIHFPIKVPANGETTVKYTVEYTW